MTTISYAPKCEQYDHGDMTRQIQSVVLAGGARSRKRRVLKTDERLAAAYSCWVPACGRVGRPVGDFGTISQHSSHSFRYIFSQ